MTIKEKKLLVNSYLKPSANKTQAFVVLYVDCQDDKRFKTYTGISVDYEEPKGKSKKNSLQITDHVKGSDLLKLEKIKQDLVDIISDLKTKNLSVTKERLKNKLAEKIEKAEQAESKSKESEEKNLLIPYVQKLPKGFLKKADNPITSDGTIKSYDSLAINLEAYQELHDTVLRLGDMNKQFFTDFNTFLEERHTYKIDFRKKYFPKYYGTKLRPNYRHSKLKSLKSLLNWLRTEGVKIGGEGLDYSTYKYPAKMRDTTRNQYHLTEDHLNLIYALRDSQKIKNKPNKEQWIQEIDRTILNCWLGQRFGDATHGWTKNDFHKDVSGNWVLIIESEKTETETTIPIIEGAYNVMQENNWKPLPEISNTKANEWIKKICELAGLTQEVRVEKSNKKSTARLCDIVTTRYWRRSMINNLLAKGISEKTVKEIGGFSVKGNAIRSYYNEEKKQGIKTVFETFKKPESVISKNA